MRHYKKEALLYIEPRYNKEFNETIAENYHLITDIFNHISIPFIYLPKLLTDHHTNKVLAYNYPYLKESNQTHPGKLYHVIANSLHLKIDGPTLLYLSNDGDVKHQFDLPSLDVFSSPERLFLFVEEIRDTIRPIIEDDSDSILFRRGDMNESLSFDSMFDSLEEDKSIKSYRKPTSFDLFKNKSKKKTAEDLFEEQAFIIPNDLHNQIEALTEAGYLSHLIKYLEILQQTTQKLSRLKITQDYRIYLMDYEMKEVEMSPLPKALYILFLHHPKGISFKELPDYSAELMTIYQNISLRESPDKARKSIEKLTDPFDNSVHEKCSRIRAAFLSVVAENIAKNYYITGDRAEAKTILLDRELVIYEK